MAAPLASANPIDDLLDLSRQLHEYEHEYDLSSAEFYKQYQAGTQCNPPRISRRRLMSLHNYLVRFEATLRSRQDIKIENLHLVVTTIGAINSGNLCFLDGSRLSIVEQVEEKGQARKFWQKLTP